VRLGPAETREEGSLRGCEVMSLRLFTEDQTVGIPGEAGGGGYRRPPGAAATREERHSSPASQRGIPALTFHATHKLAGQHSMSRRCAIGRLP
jgi:hypothetical protein